MKYFQPREFRCKDGTEYPASMVDAVLAPFVEGVLDPIREEFGAPLVVTSGYRTRSWNHIIGGAARSRHMAGDAADIAPAMATRDRVKALRNVVYDMERAGRLPALGGFGAYVGWIHVDARPRKPDGKLALWVGRGIGSEKA